MTKLNENTNIKQWYLETYPDDDCGKLLNSEKTFYDLFYAIDRHHDIYEEFSIEDSIVRERLFEALAIIMNVSYDYIYDQWIS